MNDMTDSKLILSAFADEAGASLTEQIAALSENNIPYIELRGVNGKIISDHTPEEAAALRAGDYVYLTGVIYTARDAAHKRMNEALDAGESFVSRDAQYKVTEYYGVPSIDFGSHLLEVIERDTERDNYLSAKEAVEYGLIDKVITKKDI